MKIVYRQTQEIPFDKWIQEFELEAKTDREEGRLGMPAPKRYRMWTGCEHSQIRVHERAFDDFASFGKTFEMWAEDEIGQQLEVERHNFYVWEREELYFIDDPIDVDALRAELAEIEKNKKN